ncbi:hypothetical protein H632_c8p4 [Helicosporidium sp. ATCC 50920]|nr:hypothetical protein H632_c8p4 [Helicosporidium sp. ATCC 50920]|eukprot:KDD77151.1 hypothetical protein H632_c8p4 [Helicosporidium sp. ATCC 50920]
MKASPRAEEHEGLAPIPGPTAPPRRAPRPRVIGYAMRAGKVAKHVTPALTSRAAAAGLAVRVLDPRRPLQEQGRLDAVLHKVVAPDWVDRLEHYMAGHPEVAVPDPPRATQTLRHRGRMLSVIPAEGWVVRESEGESSEGCHATFAASLPSSDPAPVSYRCTVPSFTTLERGESASALAAQLKERGLAYPLMIKPMWADGRPGSHSVAIVSSERGLEALLARQLGDLDSAGGKAPGEQREWATSEWARGKRCPEGGIGLPPTAPRSTPPLVPLPAIPLDEDSESAGDDDLTQAVRVDSTPASSASHSGLAWQPPDPCSDPSSAQPLSSTSISPPPSRHLPPSPSKNCQTFPTIPQLPVIAQEYVPHGDLLIKVYVLGSQTRTVLRGSVCLHCRREGAAARNGREALEERGVDSESASATRADASPIPLSRSQPSIPPSLASPSKSTLQAEGLETLRRVSDHRSAPGAAAHGARGREGGQREVPEAVLAGLGQRLRDSLGLDLFNFDVIVPLDQGEGESWRACEGGCQGAGRDSSVKPSSPAAAFSGQPGRLHVIDINHFPGYEKLENYETLMVNYFLEVLDRCRQSSF